MGYVDKMLGSQERVILEFKIHWIRFIFPVLFSFAIIGIPSLIRLLYTQYVLTDKRVILKTGFISRHTEELRLKKIETVEIRQGIIGRILGYGNIYITGTGTSYVLFDAVFNPMAVKRQIEDLLD